MKKLLDEGFDAIFVGTGAPRGRDLDVPGRKEAGKNIHIGIDWLSSVSFGHVSKIGKRVIVLGGGNTAMDCCRTSRRLGGTDVKVIVRSGFDEMKASPWEKEDAMHEGIPILNYLVPKEFVHDSGKLTGVIFEKVEAVYDAQGRRSLVPTGEPDEQFDCDDVLIAVGQENAFSWIERDCGIEFNDREMPVVDETTFQSSLPGVLFGGDAAFGPKNIIWAVAHGHEAAISIDRLCNGEDTRTRPGPLVNLISQKMGIHEWTYDNDIATECRSGNRRLHSRTSTSKSNSVSTRSLLLMRRNAVSTVTCRQCFPRHCVSNVMPASISARWTASRSLRMVKSKSCATGSMRRRRICLRICTLPGRSRPDASWSRTKMSVCIADFAPSVARQALGICANSCSI
jgi:thioredoxin reductase